jgi:hypothetical protein
MQTPVEVYQQASLRLTPASLSRPSTVHVLMSPFKQKAAVELATPSSSPSPLLSSADALSSNLNHSNGMDLSRQKLHDAVAAHLAAEVEGSKNEAAAEFTHKPAGVWLHPQLVGADRSVSDEQVT